MTERSGTQVAEPGPFPQVIIRGTGSIGLRHLEVFQSQARARPVAYPARAERVAELRARGYDAIGSLRELDAAGVVGGVVATNTSQHLEDAAALLELGDVLIEKPLAPSGAGLPELQRAAERHGRRIFVAFCLRFHAGLRRFRALLPRIGAVDSVRIQCRSFLPDWRPDRPYRASYSARAEEGGVLRDLAHELDYAVWLFGRPREVYCLLGNAGRLGIGAEESADLLWRVDGGPHVSIRLDYVSRLPSRRMEASGEGGELSWDAIAGEVRLNPVEGAPEVFDTREERNAMMERQARAFLSAAVGDDPEELTGYDEAAFVVALSDAAREERNAMMERQARAFLNAAVGGDPEELAGFDEAAFVVALSDAARAADRTRRSMEIADWRSA